MLNRRMLTTVAMALLLAAGSGASADTGAGAGQDGDLALVKVWKSPTCGCCGKWIKHMQGAGFRVEVTDVADVEPIKVANGVPPKLASCHTALVGGYVIEGHVPASDVRRLLKEKPGILGLAAPGMPPGSPGMDVPGSPPFEVLAFGKDGKPVVYATHDAGN